MLIECAIFTVMQGKLNIQMSPSKKEHFALGIAHSLFFDRIMSDWRGRATASARSKQQKLQKICWKENHMKKFLAMLVAAMMVLSLVAIPVLADGEVVFAVEMHPQRQPRRRNHR